MDFLGSFHPLVLHLPIGSLIAAFLLECYQYFQKQDKLDFAIRLLLAFTAVTAVISALFGYFLSQKGGYQGITFEIHQWSGFALAFLSVCFYFFKTRLGTKSLWAAWGIILALLTVLGHFGGSLTHGEDFLLADAPPLIKKVFQKESGSQFLNPDSALVFNDIIQPIIREKCISCHNETKKQGDLNLGTVSSWKAGGKNGDLFNEEDPAQSLLLERIYLPEDHEEHMPPEGQQQLLPSEVALIEWWISSGMPFEEHLPSVQKPERIAMILADKIEPFNPYEDIKVEPLSEDLLDEMKSRGITVLNISQNSPLLEIRLAGFSEIGSATLDLLSKAKNHIVRMDLQSSGISDEQLKEIATFPNLVHLSLQETSISDQGISYLKDLKYLQHLNIHSTQITDQSLSVLTGFEHLQVLYLWNTRVSEESIDQLRSSRPDLNLGLI